MNNELYEKGLKVRREVLGAEFVDKSIASATDFNRIAQEITTTACWGLCWGNDDLTRRERSLVNLAMISVLNRPHELSLHVKGALRNGLTETEIRGALTHVAIYGGIPAGMDSFRIASQAIKEFREQEAEQSDQ
ncbi:carboxymuconolactone decarboxylase family protein [Advenella mimigardefordensis]|uniref:Putative 4-carboxymuconolactone decarboxylase n=1 Tax=Advenella mimigardefordensis (strain DSM 17166 / LMG 22922 / DPN7) TaxID=1247726 RepID=W0PF40_ADVMD|nr:carboxymuconolactone decarboxylase family protein [Advenella mimigardefordensis]AHG65619.1 putative 4-carboxymuconolactone decarboxylase [Advenella mimigardefordensis DPN7]